MTYASGNAVANLEATLTKAKTNVLEAPIISTTNNRPASISVGQEVPISQSISNITPQGTQITTTSVTYIPVENSLNITPHINGDNSVSLFVAPQLQTEGTSQIPGYPLISNQSLTTYRRIANGQTMVLGGFITKQDNRSTEDVPYLSQLPIVGNLFKSYDHSIDNSEVLVFLTPQIIEDRPQGSIGTAGSNPPATP
jgi:type II secretory pathway component GspD/PulD (secretin)